MGTLEREQGVDCNGMHDGPEFTTSGLVFPTWLPINAAIKLL